jgi:hypothetical protein
MDIQHERNVSPKYTAAVKGNKSIDVKTTLGNPKLGCTIGLTIGSNGEKLPAHVVFREPGFVRQIRGLENIPQNVRVTSSRLVGKMEKLFNTG